ncbi:outer membrane beta-barrel protein [Marinobacter sp. V034]|uniref:outer membrane beta-barrel protein n=1 Tax=Marinobacter sp. V034 TaxID=3459610 RepID=UPI00404486C3
MRSKTSTLCCTRFLWLLMPLLALGAGTASADGWWWDDKPQPQVQVAEPFIEWHTGPASAYPVIRVSEKGEWLTLLMRKTQWFKVQDDHGREGWVHIDDLLLTLDGQGEQVTLSRPRFDDFSSRNWEAGLMMGQFEGGTVTSLYGGYGMTENLSVELSGSQVLGSASEILMINGNLVHQPFPYWRVSPFFTLGGGQIYIKPKATLSQPGDRTNWTAHAGLGLRVYLADRYFLRAEFKDYKIFTKRETDEEATEWKVGLSVFF